MGINPAALRIAVDFLRFGGIINLKSLDSIKLIVIVKGETYVVYQYEYDDLSNDQLIDAKNDWSISKAGGDASETRNLSDLRAKIAIL